MVGIGSAYLDYVFTTNKQFFKARGVKPGSRQKVAPFQVDSFLDPLGRVVEPNTGGTTCNVITGLSSMGISTGFIGKVGQDKKGREFISCLEAHRVATSKMVYSHLGHTGVSMIGITPGAEPTIYTNPGVSVLLDPKEIDFASITNSKLCVVESSTLHNPRGIEILSQVIKYCALADTRIALIVSDVDFNPTIVSSLKNLIPNMDYVFGDQKDMESLFQIHTDDIMTLFDTYNTSLVITEGHSGVTITGKGERLYLPVKPTPLMVDTTGYRDLFTSGFLYGVLLNKTMLQCGCFAILAANECLTHLGTYPKEDLLSLFTRCK